MNDQGSFQTTHGKVLSLTPNVAVQGVWVIEDLQGSPQWDNQLTLSVTVCLLHEYKEKILIAYCLFVFLLVCQSRNDDQIKDLIIDSLNKVQMSRSNRQDI